MYARLFVFDEIHGESTFEHLHKLVQSIFKLLPLHCFLQESATNNENHACTLKEMAALQSTENDIVRPHVKIMCTMLVVNKSIINLHFCFLHCLFVGNTQ